MNYVAVETILNKLSSLIRKNCINETDVIEYIGSAMGFMRVVNVQEPHVAFIEVKNYTAPLPTGFRTEIQIAKNNKWVEDKKYATPACIGTMFDNTVRDVPQPNPEDVEYQVRETACVPCTQITDKSFPENKKRFSDCFSHCRSNDHPANLAGYPIPLDGQGAPMIDVELSYYRPYFDTVLPLDDWTLTMSKNKSDWAIIKKATHNFSAALGSTHQDTNVCSVSKDTYTFVGSVTKFLRFSFECGFIALAYFKDPVDERGYPLVPDNENYIEAVIDYIKWKLSEEDFDSGKEGSQSRMIYYKSQWEKRSGQAISWAKMPKTKSDWDQIANQMHNLIPNFQDSFGEEFGETNH